MARKKPIISPLGQWAYPGEVTIIPSSDITMKGVNYPVLGVDNLGNSQMMMPGQDYTFPGDYVTEIPQMGKGGLRQWFDEKWVDVKTGKTCGRSGKDKNSRPYPACRPSKRVNETTPKTSSELSSAEKARFKREKTSGKRIDYNHKRREDGGETGWLDEYQTAGEVSPKSIGAYTNQFNEEISGLKDWYEANRKRIGEVVPEAYLTYDQKSYPKPYGPEADPMNYNFSANKDSYNNKLIPGVKSLYDPITDTQTERYFPPVFPFNFPKLDFRFNGNESLSTLEQGIANYFNYEVPPDYDRFAVTKFYDANPPYVANWKGKQNINISNEPINVDRFTAKNDPSTILSHETSHYLNQNNPEVFLFNRTKLAEMGITDTKGFKDYYGDGVMTEPSNTIDGGTKIFDGLGKDRKEDELLSDAYALKQDMRKKGFYDYTKGEKLTPEIWNKYKKEYPDNFIINRFIPVFEEQGQNNIEKLYNTHFPPLILNDDYNITDPFSPHLKNTKETPTFKTSDERIIHLLNEIVKNKDQNLNIAKYGGWLSKYQPGGGWAGWTPNVGKPYMRTSPAGNAGYSDNTRVVNQNTNVSAANRKAAEAAEYAKRVGSISQGKTKSAYEKAREATSFVAQGEKRNGSASPLDYVLDTVNPASLAFAATDLVGNTGSAVSNAAQGNFAEAGTDLLGAGLNALQIIPAAKALKPFTSSALKGVSKYADDVVQTSKIAGKPTLPTYKNVYRTEHANYNKLSTPDDVTGRWALNDLNGAEFYVRNLKTPRGDGYVTKNYLKGEVEPVRIMRERLPEYKMKQQFAEGMPEQARIMSVGLGKLTDQELNTVLGEGAVDRLRKGIMTEMDINTMSTAPFMFNTTEGILDANTINKLRQGENTFLGRGKTNLFPDQKKAVDYLDAQDKANYFASPFTKYLPFSTYQDAGEVPSDIERMQGAEIFKKRSWLDKLRGYVHKGEKAIGLDPYNERSDDFMEQWARRINTATGGKDWYKQPNDASGTGGIGTAMMETVMAPFSAPQLASVYGATGKVQMPSEAMNIQNPVGSFLADAILDPTNLVGAGIAKNLGKGSLQNMIRNRSRGVRPDFTPNVSNQLAPPPSEIIVDPTTGQFNSYFNQDMERPYFDEWVRMMNNNASELDVSNLFANPAESIDLRKLKKIAKNRSGLTKEEILKNASPKDKEVLSKMSESEFEQTVLKPTGEVVPYEPAVNLGLGFNTNTRNLNLSDVIPMDNSEYVDIFNSRLDRLNEIISRNNKSGLDYSVKGLSPSGALTFNTPAQIEKLAPDTAVLNQLRNRGFMDEAGNIDPRFQDYADRWGITGNRNIPQGESTWMLDINPGQWRGEVEDIANAEYFKAIPGLNMRNTTASVFSDALPRRGTGTYNSINEYLKELDLGRVKPGFNSQSQSSSGLWEDAIKKGKAFGYFNNPGTVYGSMRTVSPLVAGAAAASQLPEQKNGGWLDIYQDGGENLPELNSKIDIANFYKNPLSEKYGIYQDPEDDTYKYYLKSGDESSILQSGPDLSNINSRRLAEINSQKGSLSNAQLANIKNVSPVILPEQKQRILRDKVYYDQEDLMEQAMSESPIPSVKTPSYSEILESDPEFKRVMTEKPKPVAPIKPKPVATNTPLVPIGNAPRAIVKPAVRKVVAKNNIVNLADLTITKADLAYLNKVEEYCPKGNCLETTRNAYDMTAGRIQGIPTSSDIWSNDLKVHSKKGTPTADDIKKYPYFAGDSGSGTLDSWDWAAWIKKTGGKIFYDVNNPTSIDYKQIPVGTLIGWGPANKKDSNYSGRSKGYNKQFGMQPSHHSTQVLAFSETGEPIVYDGYLGKYMTLTEAKATIGAKLGYELENVAAPKSVLHLTQDNLKNQGILLNYIPPTNIDPNKILAAANQPWAQIPEGSVKRAPRFNKQMMTEFNSALINNKGELMRNLNISSEKYDELAKVALAIQAQESEGGGALGVIDGSTIGMTQLNPDNIFKDDKLKKAASKPYILNDGSNNILKPELIKTPSGSAVATMIYLSKLDKDSERYYNEGKVPKDRSFTKNSNIIKDALRSNTSKYNADGFFVEEANKRIDLSPFEGGILSSPDPVGAQKLLNKTAGVADKYKVSVKNGSLVVTMKTKGNADLSVAERIGYAWQSPNTLKSGDAQGDSVYTRRIKNYYDLLNNTTPTYRKEGGETGWLNKYK